MFADLVKRNADLEAENKRLREHCSLLEQAYRELKEKNVARERRLEEIIKALRDRIYGRRSEKLDPNQKLFPFMELANEAGAQLAEEAKQKAAEQEEAFQREKQERPRRRGRKPIPKDLPRQRVVLDLKPEDRKCPCCQEEMGKIGEDVTEELDYQPASLFVREIVRPKYACKRCQEGVLTHSLPPRPIEKGRPGLGLLAHVAVSKFGDHLPLYRLEGIFERHGGDLHRSTLCDWMGEYAKLLRPIYIALKREILSHKLIQGDDTPVMVQIRGMSPRTRRAYLWAYGVPWGAVVYDFTLSRARDGPLEFLDGYRGYLQTDGYSGFAELFRQGDIIQVGCTAHSRRRFHAAREDDPRAVIVLGSLQQLYRIERKAREEGLDLGARLQLRVREALPILTDLKALLECYKPQVLPASNLGDAIQYTLNQWAAIIRYTEVAEAEIDNNSIENAIRPVALGRKNWLQLGSEEGGKRAAILYSLVQTCKRLKLDPFAYLCDVSDRLLTCRDVNPAALTPGAWKAERQASEAA